jgi:hypothetical protein
MEYADPSYSSVTREGPSAAKVEDLNTNKPKSGPRKRVSQACDRGRSRKDKCDGKKPACSTCTTHGRICSYDTNVKKRGLPEGYVRGLEKLWGLAIRDVAEVEENVLIIINSESRSDDFLVGWKDEGNSDNLVDIWRKSKISKELENLLSNTEQTTDSRKRKHADTNSQAESRAWLPPTHTNNQRLSDPERSVWVDRKSSVFTQENPRDLTGLSVTYNGETIPSDIDKSLISPSYQQYPSGKRQAVSAESIELPSEAWHLINVYSSYTHPWLPIIERQDLLRSTYQYLRKTSDFSITGPGSGDHAVLWAVIAYEKLQHRAINRIPQAQGPVAEVVWTAEKMYDQARNLIPNEDGVFELGHVQALLVLALANIGNGRLSRAWLLVGQATRIAIDMGLGRQSDDILMALKSPSRTKHVFLACFVLDTIIAARLGYRPHLRAEDAELVGPVEEEGLDEWDPWQDCLQVCRASPASRPASILSTFNQFVKLMQILNEAICEPDTPRRAITVKELLYKLSALGQGQPSPLNFDTASRDGEQEMTLLPHHYNLQIAHHSILATMQLMSHTQDKGGPNLESSAVSAQSIVELLIQHSSQFGLLIIPPTFEFYVKSAYDVVRELQSRMEESNTNPSSWKHSLEIYTDIMEPAWPVFESLKGSISYQASSSGRRESQVAFDLISGTNQVSDTPPTSSTPSSLTSSHAAHPVTSRYKSEMLTNSATQHARPIIPPVLSRTRPFGLSTGEQFAADNYPPAQSSFDLSNPVNTNLRHRNIHVPQISHSSNPETSPTHVRQRLSISGDVELDPMFQEFATLDATEWYSF